MKLYGKKIIKRSPAKLSHVSDMITEEDESNGDTEPTNSKAKDDTSSLCKCTYDCFISIVHTCAQTCVYMYVYTS